MAKFISVATGLEVPATDVAELSPGSGIYVHMATVVRARVESSPPPAEEEPSKVQGEGLKTEGGGSPAQYTDGPFGRIYRGDKNARIVNYNARAVVGYVVRIGDAETYSSAIHSPFKPNFGV